MRIRRAILAAAAATLLLPATAEAQSNCIPGTPICVGNPPPPPPPPPPTPVPPPPTPAPTPVASVSRPAVPRYGRSFKGARLRLTHAGMTFSGPVFVRVLCPPNTYGFCSGQLTLRRRGTQIGAAPFGVRSFDGPSVKVPLSLYGRRLVRRAKRLVVSATLASEDGLGRRVRRSERLTIYAPGLARPSSVLATASAYGFERRWGSQGKAPGQFGNGRQVLYGDRQFNSPGGIAVNAGRVFVADTSNNRIQHFDGTGRLRDRWGRFGFDPGNSRGVRNKYGFILPQGVATDPQGNVYVADSRNDRVMKFSAAGGFIRRIGRRGSLGGELVSPWGVAVHGGIVYVVDQGNYRLSRFRASSGRYLGSFGDKGIRRGQWVAPYGVAVGPDGTIYVTENARHIVMRFSARGRYLGYFGGTGSAPGQLRRPTGIAVEPAGTVLVSDCANQRISRYSAAGAYIESFGLTHLRDPTFLAVDEAGGVFVSDFRRVVKFTPSGTDAFGSLQKPPGRLACSSQASAAELG